VVRQTAVWMQLCQVRVLWCEWVFAVCVYVVCAFSALTLLVGWQEGHPVCVCACMVQRSVKPSERNRSRVRTRWTTARVEGTVCRWTRPAFSLCLCVTDIVRWSSSSCSVTSSAVTRVFVVYIRCRDAAAATSDLSPKSHCGGGELVFSETSPR